MLGFCSFIRLLVCSFASIAMRPLIVTSDLHLSADASAATVHALTQLIRSNPGHELILAGDVFNLSWEAPGSSAVEAVLSVLSAYPELGRALREHLSAGAPLTFVAGNHDAGIMAAKLREALLQKLDFPGKCAGNCPWFVRRGDVHVEHGHFYDPDNAPAHPWRNGLPRLNPWASPSLVASCVRAARTTFRTRMTRRRSLALPKPFACTARARR